MRYLKCVYSCLWSKNLLQPSPFFGQRQLHFLSYFPVKKKETSNKNSGELLPHCRFPCFRRRWRMTWIVTHIWRYGDGRVQCVTIMYGPDIFWMWSYAICEKLRMRHIRIQRRTFQQHRWNCPFVVCGLLHAIIHPSYNNCVHFYLLCPVVRCPVAQLWVGGFIQRIFQLRLSSLCYVDRVPFLLFLY